MGKSLFFLDPANALLPYSQGLAERPVHDLQIKPTNPKTESIKLIFTTENTWNVL
jgi:hypothetical protein